MLYCLHHLIHLIFLIFMRYLAEHLLFFAHVSENFCVNRIFQISCIQYFGIYRLAFAGFIGHLFLAGLSIIRDEVSGFFIGIFYWFKVVDSTFVLKKFIFFYFWLNKKILKIKDHLWSIKSILYFLLVFFMIYIGEKHFIRIAFLSAYLLPFFLVTIYLLLFNIIYIFFDPNLKNVLSTQKKSKPLSFILPKTKLKIIKIVFFIIAAGKNKFCLVCNFFNFVF